MAETSRGPELRYWFRIRDTYGVDMADNADAPLILAIAVCVDRLIEHEHEEEQEEDD